MTIGWELTAKKAKISQHGSRIRLQCNNNQERQTAEMAHLKGKKLVLFAFVSVDKL